MQEPDPHSRARKRWACLLFGLWAFTVRQTALAAPAAVLLVDLVKRDTRRRGAVQAAALLAACAGFWWWRSTLPGSQRPDGRPPLFMVAELLVASFFTFALMMTPVLVWTAPRWLRPRHRRGRFAGAAAGAALACYPLLAARWSWTHRPMWLTGDYLDPRGVGADKLALGHRAALIPAPVWTLLTGVAVLSGITLCTLLAEAAATRSDHRSEPDPATRVLAAHLALTGLGLAVAAVADGNLYDRYLWPALVPAGVLLAARREAPAVWSPLGYQKAGLAVAAVLAAALAAESDAFDAALWRAGSTAVAAHYPAATVDAGFGWAGAHARGPVRADPPDVPSGRSWWSVMDGDHPVCVQVSASPLTTPGLHPLGSLRWDPLPVLGPERLYVYGTGDRACPDPAMLETLLNRS